MAQRVNIVLEDDLDGSEADETVSFALDGTTYEIDLSADNAAKLRDALAPYVGHGRRASGRRAPARSGGGSSRSGGAKRDLADVREWARANGHKVSDRGRISAEIQAAYFVAAFATVATASLTLGPVVHRASLDTAMVVAMIADLVLTTALTVLLIRDPATLAGTDSPSAP